MRKPIDLTNHRFGMLLALSISGAYGASHCAVWRCQCDCGRTINLRGSDLRSGRVRNCGCQKITRAIRLTKLGRPPISLRTEDMIQRFLCGYRAMEVEP